MTMRAGLLTTWASLPAAVLLATAASVPGAEPMVAGEKLKALLKSQAAYPDQ